MAAQGRLAEEFDRSRNHLLAVAYRMLGSAEEAEDAVQEAWLRASSADADAVDNLTGWLTVIVSRICLDMLRSRQRRREEFVDAADLDRMADDAGDPQDEAALADSVGLALLVVLDTLTPAERVAFVLHDMFAVPFDEIATIIGRSPTAAKKLASRARQRISGKPVVPKRDLSRQRAVVEAFIAASRAGDIDGLLAVLAPDVVRRAEPALLPTGVETELRGARRLAEETVGNMRRARFAGAALVNGVVGVVVAPRGILRAVIQFAIVGDRITEMEVIGSPERLERLELAVLDEVPSAAP
ncbi:MAG TPA: sigma-70 family RNA polymerase sigma factor [Mycobacterium sp.]|nr:sigma-70 family RNA polymerase sigma factor [Mycobacterium sp.]